MCSALWIGTLSIFKNIGMVFQPQCVPTSHMQRALARIYLYKGFVIVVHMAI